MNDPLNRRDFLKSAALFPLAAAATGLGLGASSAFAAAEPIKRTGGAMLKVSLNAYSFSRQLNPKHAGMSLFDALDFCAKCNFDGFDATGYFFPTYPQVPPVSYVNALKRQAFELGIGISGTGVRNNFTTADAAARAADVHHIKEWIQVASWMGAPVLRVFADTQRKNLTWHDVAPGCTRDQVEEWIANDIRECAVHAGKFGVMIGVQNHGDFLKTSDDLLSLINRVDSEWCGAIVDTGYFKSKDPYEDMARLAPYAVNWQIKRSPFGEESSIPLDLKKLLRIVRASGYRGYLPIEALSGDGDPFTVVPRLLLELRQAIAETA